MAVATPFSLTGIASKFRAVDASGIITTPAVHSSDPVYLGFGAFNSIAGMAVDAAGNMYLADSGHSAIYKVDPSLNVTCLLGQFPAAYGYSGDGGPAKLATVKQPNCIAFDAAGNIYLSDPGTYVIRVINMQATQQTILGVLVGAGCIQTVAGNGTSLIGHSGGYNNGDGGPAIAAGICGDGGITLDGFGNLYICDENFWCRVRRVDHATGIITTLAGIGTGIGGGYSGDGGLANAAALNTPAGLACDPAGNVYIADLGNDRIRAVNMQATTQTLLGVVIGAGCIQTVAGNGGHGYNGDGLPPTGAELRDPRYVSFDAAGNLYICDPGNNRVRLVDPLALLISTVAGNGTNGVTGDGGPAIVAEIAGAQSTVAFFQPTGPSVSERRFATNGCFESTSAYGDVLKSLALSMAGFVVPPGDCWRVYAGSYVPPEITLADADCRSSIKGDFRLSSRDTCNGVKGQYIPAFLPINPLGPLAASPASAAWKKTDFPPVQRLNYITEDGGVILWKDIQLDFTISLWMAQRIARIVLERLRRQVTISLPAKLTGIAALAADTIEFLHPRWATVTPAVPEVFQVAHTALRMESQEDGVPAFGTDLLLRQTDAQVYEFAQPVSNTDFGDYSPYGQTGVGAGNVE